MRRLLILVCVLAGTGCILGAYGQGGRSFVSNGRTVDIVTFDNEVRAMMDSIGIPGASLAVIENNRIVYSQAYGIKKGGGREKVDSRTVFEGCSLSKSFLVMVAYQLVDEGKLDLDKPMYQYLPYERLEHDPRYRLITPRMILSHSSGIENWQHMNDPKVLEIVSDPGTAYVYSGEGYQYLAKVIEKILHQSYQEYITRRVIRPLKLKNSYLKFTSHHLGPFHWQTPGDYATGTGMFGGNHVLYNIVTIPAAGNHFTAEDYAKLIVGIFDTAHISESTIKIAETPIIRMDDGILYYGPGFEVVHHDGDVIMAHGGDNPGFKAQYFYSVVKKRGIVFMTNSDRGKSMDARLNALTAGLDIRPFINSTAYLIPQYPDPAVKLLNIYDRKGSDAMFEALAAMKTADLDANSLNGLARYFNRGGKGNVYERLLKETIARFPDSSLACAFLAGYYADNDVPDSSYKYYSRARELHFRLWDIDNDIKQAEKDRAEAERRRPFLVKLDPATETTVQAEDYNNMKGVKLEPTIDTGGGQNVGSINPGDWMDYRVNVVSAGLYAVTFRTASMDSANQLQLINGDSVLATVKIGSTQGWQSWRSFTTRVRLPAGIQTLRVYVAAGWFGFNWMKFALADDRLSQNHQ